MKQQGEVWRRKKRPMSGGAAGYRWPNSIGVDRDLLRKIIRAEIGGTS